jgi:hypothetical protein
LRPCGPRAEQRDHRRRDRHAAVRFGEVGDGDRTGGTSAGRDDIGSPHISAESDSDANSYTETDPDSDNGADADTDADLSFKPQP